MTTNSLRGGTGTPSIGSDVEEQENGVASAACTPPRTAHPYDGDLISAAALLANADEPWRDCAERAARHLASVGVEFTADSLTELGVPDPDHPSRWGSLFAALKAEGVIVATGYKASTRKSRNGGATRCWIGATAALNAA